MNFRTPLARVRGDGSAHEGAHHWWMQRVTAAALVPLGLWFAVSLMCLAGAGQTGHAEFVTWMARPTNSILLMLLVASGFYHGWLGVRVVVEDYVSAPATRTAVLALGGAVTWIAAAAAALAILRAGFGSV